MILEFSFDYIVLSYDLIGLHSCTNSFRIITSSGGGINKIYQGQNYIHKIIETFL